jgi:hypothetical protein
VVEQASCYSYDDEGEENEEEQKSNDLIDEFEQIILSQENVKGMIRVVGSLKEIENR